MPVKTNHGWIISGEHKWEIERTIMCKSPTNNSLASSDSSMWSNEEKTKSCSILCQEFVSVFLPKTELIPAGYPCVGCLPLLTRRYSAQMPANMTSTSCLWLYAGILPPKEKKEAQNGVSTSAILGPLQNAITSFAFWLFFFLKLFHRDKEKAAVVPSTVKKKKKRFQTTLDSLKLEPSCKVRENSNGLVSCENRQADCASSLTKVLKNSVHKLKVFNSAAIKVGMGQCANSDRRVNKCQTKCQTGASERSEELRCLHKLASSHKPRDLVWLINRLVLTRLILRD